MVRLNVVAWEEKKVKHTALKVSVHSKGLLLNIDVEFYFFIFYMNVTSLFFLYIMFKNTHNPFSTLK